MTWCVIALCVTWCVFARSVTLCVIALSDIVCNRTVCDMVCSRTVCDMVYSRTVCDMVYNCTVCDKRGNRTVYDTVCYRTVYDIECNRTIDDIVCNLVLFNQIRRNVMETYRLSCAPNEDSSYSFPCSRAEVLHYWVSKMRSVDSDQTAFMYRLICSFSVRTCPKVRFLTLLLKCNANETIIGKTS